MTPAAPESPATASAASTVNPPANTPKRANIVRAPRSSRARLHEIVSANVRWRSGRSRGPPVSSSNGCASRATISAGDSSLTRAAASSIANGRPSTRAQIALTAPAFAVRKAEIRAHGPRPLKEELDSRIDAQRVEFVALLGIGQREWRDRKFVLARQSQAPPTGGQDFEQRASSEQLGHHHRGGRNVLEVVKDEQHPPVEQERRDAIHQCSRRPPRAA